jgi:PKD repeat protein/Leucine-rich repeat (LRR) protein
MSEKKSKSPGLFQWINARIAEKKQSRHRENKYLNLWILLIFAFTWSTQAAEVVHAQNDSTPKTPAAICDSQTEIPRAECVALEDFYQSTGGEDWLNHTGWLASQTPCSWFGVLCQAGHVVGIWFDYGNNLRGYLPASIGEMNSMRYLKLNDNQLGGSIPPGIGSLSEMVAMDLSHNLLEGLIPNELWNLQNLQYLDLGHNRLSGGLSAAVGNLTGLTFLNLSENHLSGSIPATYGNLSQITGVFLFSNHFSGTIPAELANLPFIYEIYLFDNQLSGPIPPELGETPTLQTLDVSYNALQGEFPASLANRTVSLKFLKIEGNRLEANDASTHTYLDLKNPEWSKTQTWAPAALHVQAVSTQSVTLAWTPIEFNWGDGNYVIEACEGANGPFQQIAKTDGKAASNFQVSGLRPDTDYSFRVRTHSAPYEGQQNDLMSEYTPAVSARTYASVDAGFEVSDQIGAAPMLVSFTNHSTGDPYQMLWDFGDGVTSTLESPQHIYAAAGEYSVSLAATGNGGSDSLTRPALIHAYDGLDVNLPTDEGVNLTYATQGFTVTFSSAPQPGNGPVKVLFMPDEPILPVPLGYRSLDFGFRMAVVQANQWLEFYQFAQPFIVRIAGLSSAGAPLLMEYQDEGWQESGCSDVSGFQETQAFPICHAGHYALFEKEISPSPPRPPESPVFLPLVKR